MVASELLALWFLLVLATGARTPDFLSHQTAIAIAFNMAYVGVLAVGMGFVTKAGGELDLSVVVTATASALLLASLLNRGWNFLPSLFAIFCFGVAVGAVNAVLVVRLRIHPIIATLGTYFIISGVTESLTTFVLVPPQSFLRKEISRIVLGMPVVFWFMLIILMAAECFFELTRPGRHFAASGGSDLVARVRGIGTQRIHGAAFIICGAMASIAGVILASGEDIVQPSSDISIQFTVIAAVLLGGISISGGRGRFLGLLAALLLLGTVPTAIVTWRVSSLWQPVIAGFILAVALIVDARRTN